MSLLTDACSEEQIIQFEKKTKLYQNQALVKNFFSSILDNTLFAPLNEPPRQLQLRASH